MRISVVASAYERSSFSCATFATFVPGRELQLVARHARAGDLADHGRLDAEVREGLRRAPRRRARSASAFGPRAGLRPRAGARGRAAGTRRRAPRRTSNRLVLRRARAPARDRAEGGGVPRLGDDVRVVADGVDRRRLRLAGQAPSPSITAQRRCCSAGVRATRLARAWWTRVAGAAHDRAERGAGEEERAREQRERAEDRDAGAAEREPDAAAEHRARRSRRGRAEREHQAEDEDRRARCGTAAPRRGRCGPPSARRDRERGRQRVRRRADERVEARRRSSRRRTRRSSRPEHAARKTPSATSPRPISSGCWCPCGLPSALRRRLTRFGTRGLSVRLFRRRAIARRPSTRPDARLPVEL